MKAYFNRFTLLLITLQHFNLRSRFQKSQYLVLKPYCNSTLFIQSFLFQLLLLFSSFPLGIYPI